MKKVLVFCVFLWFSNSLFSQPDDYLITQNGDTLKGKLKINLMKAGPMNHKSTNFTFKEKSISKEQFDFNNTKQVMFEGKLFIPVKLKSKAWKKKPIDLLHLVYENENAKLFAHMYAVSTTQGKYIIDKTRIDYYFYDTKNEPIEILKDYDFKDMLPKYFSSCDRLMREIKYNRKLKFEDAIDILNNFCKK